MSSTQQGVWSDGENHQEMKLGRSRSDWGEPPSVLLRFSQGGAKATWKRDAREAAWPGLCQERPCDLCMDSGQERGPVLGQRQWASCQNLALILVPAAKIEY